MVTVPVPQAVDVGGLKAAYLAIQQTRLGTLGAVGPPRGEPPPLAETVRLEEAAQRRIRRHSAKLRMLGGERDQVVVMQPGAPALVRGVLRQHGCAQRRTDRGLPAGVGAQLAAQHTDWIVSLPARPGVPALDRGDAKTDRLAADRMAPLPRRKLGQFAAQFALRGRRPPQLADLRKTEPRPKPGDPANSSLFPPHAPPLPRR